MSVTVLGSLVSSPLPGSSLDFNKDPPKDWTSCGDERDQQIRLFLDCFGEHVLHLSCNGGKGVKAQTFSLGGAGLCLASERDGEGDGKRDHRVEVNGAWDSLVSSCCLTVREVASTASMFRLVRLCDSYIHSKLSEMLNSREILSLPRLQVNVNVSENSQDLWSAGNTVMDTIILAVINELHDTSALWNGEVLGEKLLEMDLQSDLSVLVSNSKKSTKYLSPAKPMIDYINLAKKQPSPARKLELGDGLECDDSFDITGATLTKDWSLVASVNVSGTAVVCLVNRSLAEGLVLLNVQLVSKDSPNSVCPISPTTGIPLSTGSTLLSQMLTARSGFGLVSIGDSLMSIGGFNRGGVLSDVEDYNKSVNAWRPSGRLTSKRARMGVAKWKDSIYAIGGSDGKFELNSVEELQLANGKKWKLLDAKLHTARSEFGVAVLNDKIYAVGGTSYSRALRSAEVFDIKERKWKTMPWLQIPRKGSAVVACNGKVFAIGGQQFSWNCLSSVECYDPSTNQWSSVAPLAAPRRNAVAITIEDRIYVLGGYNGSKAVGMVEVYDPIKDGWTTVEPLAVNRSGASAVVVEGSIYVVGGFTGKCFLNSMEKYDMDSEQWTSFIV